MTPAYIALGSNLDNPQHQLCQAVTAMGALQNCQLVKVSSVYCSAAVGPGSQPDYLNAVLLLNTQLTAEALLDALQRIEQAHDRVRNVRWGPRTLDLDILLYGDETIASARLTIPHPRMHKRHFVLYPLHEIGGDDLVLPDGTVLQALLKQCSSDGLVKTQYPLGVSTPLLRESH